MKKLLGLVLALCLVLSCFATADVIGTYPVSDEIIELTGWGILGNAATIDNFADNLAMQELERVTGVHVEWECVSNDGNEEKRALRLAQGDLPDIFFRAELSDEQIITLAANGKIIDLAPMIDEYAPNFAALMERDPSIRMAIQDDDGHIWSLPQITTFVLTNHNIINTKWLESVGMDIPTTIDEFYDALVAFKENDVNGNGDDSDEIPLSGTSIKNLYDLMSAFGVYPRENYGMFVYPGTDEMQCSLIIDGMKDALIFFKQLYDEGLLDPEMFSQDGNAFMAKASSGSIGVLNVPGAFVYVGNDMHWDYRGLAAFPDANGNAYTQQRSSCSKNTFCISSTCKNPEAALAFVDYLYSEEGTILTWMGIEGQTWEWINDEKTVWDWILPNAETSVSEMRHNATLQGGVGYPSAHPVWFESDMWAKQNNAIEGSLDTDMYRMPLSNCGVLLCPFFKFNPEQAEINSSIMPECNNTFVAYAVDFITGKRDIEEEWDSYVQIMKEMGIEEAIDMYQGAYDAYMAKLNG